MAHIPPRSRGTLRAQAERSLITRTIRLPVQRYMHTEAISGFVLLAATIIALIWANSAWSDDYHRILKTHLVLDVAIFSIDLSVEHWINDGLMAIFFFVVALEIKRELISGQLSTPRRAALPVIAALGGMVVPAGVYLIFNAGGDATRGWGIPMATDIAFALGVLALLGRRVPLELRIFLLGLAVVDDLGAIAVIAIAYTESISFGHLILTGVLAATMVVFNRVGFSHAAVTAVLAFLIWVAVLKSGVHATIAGVLIGALTPSVPSFSREEFAEESEALVAEYRTAVAAGDHGRSEGILGAMEELSQGTEAPLERLERLAHPWSSYVILPVFALANAGIELSGDAISDAFSSDVTIGIIAGLVFGKLIGITAFPWIASRFGIVELPRAVTWMHVVGVSLLGGIGFTVAIFITGLAFDQADLIEKGKLGILAASLFAGVVGYLILRFVVPPAPSIGETEAH